MRILIPLAIRSGSRRIELLKKIYAIKGSCRALSEKYRIVEPERWVNGHHTTTVVGADLGLVRI